MNTYSYFLRSILTASCLLFAASLAQAQWAWKDKSGSMVFSDQPPPAGVAEKDITRRPPGSRAAASPAVSAEPASTAPSGAANTAATPKLSNKDPELEKRKQAFDAKEAATQKAEADKVAAAKRDNCERAKRGKANFDSGVRISTTNAKGEREILGDNQRAEETKRLQAIIASDCS